MTTSEVNNTPGQKKCSKCGGEFSCGAAMRAATDGESFSCWCEELPKVSPAEGQDCLCPACLREATGSIASTTPSNPNAI